jgi:hypothetical protein
MAVQAKIDGTQFLISRSLYSLNYKYEIKAALRIVFELGLKGCKWFANIEMREIGNFKNT